MNKIYPSLLITAGLVIIAGTFIMYEIERGAPNSKMTTFLDALWWCVSTVTTVGYGDVVPVTSVGKRGGNSLYVFWNRINFHFDGCYYKHVL
jgi:voltage-gated potassium channel